MALSDDELIYVRSEIGTDDPPSDSDLDDAHDRLGSVNAVVLEVLRSKRAELVNAPATLSIPGLSMSTSANITSIDSQIARLLSLGGDGTGGVRVTRLTRPDRSRGPGPRSPWAF